MSDQQQKPWILFHLPEDPELLAALGRITVRHGQLDHVLKRTIKAIAGLTIEEADAALAFDSSGTLRDLIKKLAERKLGKASPAVLKLRAILSNCSSVTERRNYLIHTVYAEKLDGEALLLRHDSSSPLPTSAELNRLAEQIFELSIELNRCRLEGGFLFEALQQKGRQVVTELKKDVE